MTRIIPICCLLLLTLMQGRAQFPVRVQVNVVQPVPPYLPQIKADLMGNRSSQLNQDITSHLSIVLSYSGRFAQRIKLAGTIERVAPAPMGVSLRPDFQPAQPIIMGPAQAMLGLTGSMLQAAFGNFTENALVYTNCDLNTLRENSLNYKLPEGTYRICVTAYDYDRPGFSAPLSPPGTGCAYFTICYTAAAPQLILPVSTIAQSNSGFQDLVPHSTQVQFVWTPPASTCSMPMGPLTYELEIRRVFNGQTVTDALYNPYVFHQQNIPTTNFLLDTLKYAHVLVTGQQYIIRVKANFIPMIGSPLEVANQGYSQIGAFTWLPPNYFPMPGLYAAKPLTAKPATAGAQSPATKPLPPPGSIKPGGYINEPYTPSAACAVATPIANTNPLGGAITGQSITIDGFPMTVSMASTNTDGSYKGTGYIVWSPYGKPIQLGISFDSLRVNTDRVVYAGAAQTATDPGMPDWSVLGSDDPVSKLTTLDNGTLQSIQSHVGDGAHLLSQAGGASPVAFPLGINTSFGGAPFTLAVMGISFKSSCAGMNVLFDLNVPDLGGSLSLAATGLPVDPNGLLTAGAGAILYLPQDHLFSTGAMTFDFDACPAAGAGAVDTSKGVYVQWDPAKGLGNVAVNADLQFNGSNGIIAVDKNDQRLSTPESIHARFDFSNWNDWVASATLNNDFELAGLPGFPIHSDGLYYDHSAHQNPAGISFPSGYTGAQDAGFEGLYIPGLTMSLPGDFKTFSGSKAGGFGFNNFILDNDGVTTLIAATNILDISTGSLGGWAFSIDKISIGIVNDNFQNGMQMSGQLRLPVSSDGLQYTCNLNSADGKVDYQFVVQPGGSLKVPLWLASLDLDGNSSLVINDDANGMAVKSHLNGSIDIEIAASGFPKVSLPALSFQDMAMANRKDTSANAAAGFFFSPGLWSLGGGVPIPASLTGASGSGQAVASAGPSPSDSSNGPAYSAGPNAEIPTYPGGPNPGNPAPPYDDASSQGSLAGFSLNLSDFKPYFNLNSLTEFEAGVYFNVKVGIGFGDASVISGDAHLGILGKIDIPGDAVPSAGFDKIDCDSVSLDGGIGPVQVHGSLAFLNDDPVYGDGVKGSLSADFTFAQLNAAAQFGTTPGPAPGTSGFHYWAVGGSVFTDAGIPIGPGLMVNGFGGGAYHNMTLSTPGDAEIRSHSSVSPGTIPMRPQENTTGIQAELLVSMIEPSIVNASVTLSVEIHDGGLGKMQLNGNGFVITDPPGNNDAVAAASLVINYDFANKIFDMYVDVSFHFLIASANAPIWAHGGPDGDYLYIGRPDQGDQNRISLTLIQIGNPGDILYVDLGATAYFDAGGELPAFPPLPPDIAGNLDKSGNDNAVSTMLQLLGNAKPPNPGFMFGADVQGHVRLSLLFLYAEVDAELGFDVAFEHVTSPPAGCIQSDGSFGLNNWYGMGQFYAYFNLDVGLHVDVWFYDGDVDLVQEKAWCILQAGLPNPSWVNGEVHVEGSALGGLISVSGDFPFSFGTQCNIPFNPLDDIQMITDIAPKDSASCFAVPTAAYGVPMNDLDYPIQVPPDANHKDPYTRTFRFAVSQFQLFKQEPDGSDSLAADIGMGGGFDISADGMGSSLYPSTMLQPHTRYKMYIQCNVSELVNNSLQTPAGNSGYQDTTYYFTTGAAPDHIVPGNIAYTYPIDGQQTLLKNEFGGKGQIKMGAWQYNILPATSESVEAAGGGYNYLVYFISPKGDTISTPFTLNQANNSLDFSIPATLNNSVIYDMQVWVKPRNLPKFIALPPGIAKLMATTNNKVTTTSTVRNSKGIISQQVSSPLISTVQVAKNEITMPSENHPLGTIPIYTLRFQTSQYNSFAGKMAAYGQWASQAVDALHDITLTSANSSAERFDQFEIKGYTSACTTCDPATLPSPFPPMFAVSSPWNNNVQNDKYASDNLYANSFELSVFGMSVDLGAPEVRDLLKPDNCLSTEDMPYQQKLPPLPQILSSSIKMSAPANNEITNNVQPSSNAGAGPIMHTGGMMIALPASYKASNTPTSAEPIGMTTNFLANNSAAALVDEPRLIWKHDNYIFADYQLLHQFGVTFLNNQQQTLYEPFVGSVPAALLDALAYGNNVQLATGEYGSITADPATYSTKYNDPTLTGIANTLQGLSFQPLPPSSHTLQFGYRYPFCSGCSIGSTVPEQFAYGLLIQSTNLKMTIHK